MGTKAIYFIIFFTPLLLDSFFICDENPVEPDGKLTAKTDKQLYTVGEAVTISIQNGTSSTAFFGHCNNRIVFWFQKKENGTWGKDRGGWGMPCPAIYLMGDIAVEPKASYEETIQIREAGDYRLKFPFDWNQDHMMADSLFSNEFIIH